MGRAALVQILPGSWQADKGRSHWGVSQRREMPPSFCSLIPQVVILPIEHSPVLISVYVESQNVKHAPQYLVLSLSPCFESHVRSLLCYPEIAVRADLQQSD